MICWTRKERETWNNTRVSYLGICRDADTEKNIEGVEIQGENDNVLGFGV